MENTIKTTLHIYWQENRYDDEKGGKFVLFTSKGTMEQYGYIYVCPVDIEVPEPEGFDPRATKIAFLREEEQRVRAEFQKRITEIQREISQCMALEMSA
jgi:hypothetical protein